MNLPPQKPQRRRVALRPRNDRPWLPRFPEPRERPLRPEPFDGGSWETYRSDDPDRDNPWEAYAWVAASIVLLLMVFLASEPTL